MYLGLALGVFLAIFLPLLAVGIIVEVLFLMNLRDLLRNVSQQNRSMNPDHVWLNLIPVFNWVWMFITVIRIRDSARAEYKSRSWPLTTDFGYGAGMTYAIMVVASEVVSLGRQYSGSTASAAWSGIGSVVGIVALVCWITYWVSTNGVKNRLKQAAVMGHAPTQPYPGSWGASGGGYPTHGPSAGQSPQDPQGPPRSCSSCGTTAQPGDEFCRSCGTSLDEATSVGPPAQVDDTSSTAHDFATHVGSPATSSTCPFCGATYRPNAKYCWSCGRPAV